MATVRFVNELGAEVLVSVKGDTASQVRRAVLHALREYGRMGWRGDVPRGGFRFPLANESDFDWRLIGARPGTVTIDGEERQGVWYAGYFYTRRDLEPNPRMKLAAAVKYSRGAKSTDPPDIVEEGDGSFRYVTLAVFRGDGRRREEYAMPSAAVAPRAERGKPPFNGASAGAAVP
ncbi:MAG: single-stranded DNA-binding protein [Gemmatimonadota bacterium]